MIVLDEFVVFESGQVLRMEQQILFYLIPNDLGEDQFAQPCRAQGQGRLIEAPTRNNASGENIRIEKQSNSPLTAHLMRRRGRPRDAFREGLDLP